MEERWTSDCKGIEGIFSVKYEVEPKWGRINVDFSFGETDS